MAEGFDDIEMNNLDKEKEENERMTEDYEVDTSFNNDDYHNNSINIINTENTKSKFNRVDFKEQIPDVKKATGSMRRSFTNDRKKSFKKIFDVTFEQKNGTNNSILLDNTVFVRDPSGNTSIEFKGKKIGNVDNNLKPELFSRKNKKYVDEFNDYMNKAIKEYEKTAVAFIEQNFRSKEAFASLTVEPDWNYSPEFGN